MSDLKDEICNVFHDHWIDHETHDTAAAAQAIRDLIIARIPPLVWEVFDDQTAWATSVFGVYRYDAGALTLSTQKNYIGDGLGNWRMPTLEAAKAAANAHHVAQLCKGMGIE